MTFIFVAIYKHVLIEMVIFCITFQRNMIFLAPNVNPKIKIQSWNSKVQCEEKTVDGMTFELLK